MSFLKNLFKSEEKVLTSTTVKLIPLNQIEGNEKIRKILIDYLITKYGETMTQEIINNSNYAINDKLFPDNQIVSIHKKDGKCYDLFIINNNKIEEIKIIDKNSDL